jgi:hypothetical protein
LCGQNITRPSNEREPPQYEFVWAADGGVTLSFSPEFGVLNTKHCCTALGQYEYPDEEYFIRAKALALNAILDYKLWQEKDTLK